MRHKNGMYAANTATGSHSIRESAVCIRAPVWDVVAREGNQFPLLVDRIKHIDAMMFRREEPEQPVRELLVPRAFVTAEYLFVVDKYILGHLNLPPELNTSHDSTFIAEIINPKNAQIKQTVINCKMICSHNE
jgi:hypothetical protein